jgi:hypothetical protein
MMNEADSIVCETITARTVRPAIRVGRSGKSSRKRIVGPDHAVEEVLAEHPERLAGGGDGQRRRAHLAPVVGERREIADVIEVRVADDARLDLDLLGDLEAAGERAGVNGERLVEQERAGAVLWRLAAVAADHPELHRALSSLRQISAASRGTRGNPEGG